MKTKLASTVLIFAITIVAFAQARPDPWSIKGKVLSATAEGVIVSIVDDGMVGRLKPENHSVVFVYGLKLADDELVNVEAFPSGTFAYKSVSGAAKTVRAFQLRK